MPKVVKNSPWSWKKWQLLEKIYKKVLDNMFPVSNYFYFPFSGKVFPLSNKMPLYDDLQASACTSECPNGSLQQHRHLIYSTRSSLSIYAPVQICKNFIVKYQRNWNQLTHLHTKMIFVSHSQEKCFHSQMKWWLAGFRLSIRMSWWFSTAASPSLESLQTLPFSSHSSETRWISWHPESLFPHKIYANKIPQIW